MAHPNVLALDAGDMMGWSPDTVKHRALFRMMEYLAYDAVGIGDNDLVDGIPFLRNAMDEYGIPVVSANLSDTAADTPLGPGYRVLNRGETRIGIIGVGDPAAFALMKPNRKSAVGIGATIEALDRLLPDVREVSDLIVVLSHASQSHNRTIARRFPSIDVLVGSFSGRPLFEPLLENGVLLVQAGNNGARVGRLDLELDNNHEIVSYRGWLEPLLESMADDQIVLSMLEDYRNELIDGVVGAQDQNPTGSTYRGARTCRTCHEDQFEQWQTTSHAHALQTLIKAGNEKEPECLFCHTTGYGKPSGYFDFATTPALGDVQCEVCHRVSDQHAEMRDIPNPPTAITCIECHTPAQSPGFLFESAFESIKH